MQIYIAICSVFTGIFSDVNMLSLMYAAELCYWMVMVDTKSDFAANLAFNPCTLGRQLAHQYISIAEGPMKEVKWSTEQAYKIAQKFE